MMMTSSCHHWQNLLPSILTHQIPSLHPNLKQTLTHCRMPLSIHLHLTKQSSPQWQETWLQWHTCTPCSTPMTPKFCTLLDQPDFVQNYKTVAVNGKTIIKWLWLKIHNIIVRKSHSFMLLDMHDALDIKWNELHSSSMHLIWWTRPLSNLENSTYWWKYNYYYDSNLEWCMTGLVPEIMIQNWLACRHCLYNGIFIFVHIAYLVDKVSVQSIFQLNYAISLWCISYLIMELWLKLFDLHALDVKVNWHCLLTQYTSFIGYISQKVLHSS